MPSRHAVAEIYANAPDEWSWRLLARNGTIVAESPKFFPYRNRAVRALTAVLALVGLDANGTNADLVHHVEIVELAPPD